MSKSSPSANYSRGITMESTESIDYSSNSAKDLKPPHSYAQLIGMAILSTHEQQMTLNNIYKWIMANYAFYRFNTGGWQNSIRHNLSLNKAFTKIARRTDEPGKGMKWMIEPTEFDTFVQQGMKGCRRPAVQISVGDPQSTAASPSSPLHPARNAPSSAMGIKRRDDETTPPLPQFQPPYPRSTEAFTPDRGSRRKNIEGSNMGLGINEVTLDAAGQEAAYNLDFLRSTPRNGLTAAAHAAGSPPALYVNDEGRIGPMDTPFPLRPTARLAPPSTLRRPSDFIQFSSPAPFWKMEGLVGSTPFKPYDMSPLKTPFPMLKPKIEKIEDEDDKKMIMEAGEEDLYKDRDEEKTANPAEAEGIKSPTSADGAVKLAIEAKPTRRQSPIIPSPSTERGELCWCRKPFNRSSRDVKLQGPQSACSCYQGGRKAQRVLGIWLCRCAVHCSVQLFPAPAEPTSNDCASAFATQPNDHKRAQRHGPPRWTRRIRTAPSATTSCPTAAPTSAPTARLPRHECWCAG
jgi:hypothetical protein